ncbi:hypothetical protein MPL3356_390152 [Mesorhizobium plurifarium]|uniref:Uncharacterized protein n=1 Tax=Mesorhizobium plurifarium TaxID=69974 RepID=A0A090E595_MESPL|nr:hypothetical protein MPL3356_390152 [Mesorhizobium plurifarium]
MRHSSVLQLEGAVFGGFAGSQLFAEHCPFFGKALAIAINDGVDALTLPGIACDQGRETFQHRQEVAGHFVERLQRLGHGDMIGVELPDPRLDHFGLRRVQAIAGRIVPALCRRLHHRPVAGDCIAQDILPVIVRGEPAFGNDLPDAPGRDAEHRSKLLLAYGVGFGVELHAASEEAEVCFSIGQKCARSARSAPASCADLIVRNLIGGWVER